MNQRQTGSVGDELTNAALVGLIGLVGIALVLRAAASVTAYLTGLPQPDAGPAAGLAWPCCSTPPTPPRHSV